MRPAVDPFKKAFREEVGKAIKHARNEKGIMPAQIRRDLRLTVPQLSNIEYGKSALDKVIKVAEYLGVNYQKVARELKDQMNITDVGFLLDGDEVKTDYIVGTRVFKIRGKVAPTVNAYVGIKIINLTDDGGLSHVYPGIDRVAVHKSKIESVC